MLIRIVLHILVVVLIFDTNIRGFSYLKQKCWTEKSDMQETQWLYWLKDSNRHIFGHPMRLCKLFASIFSFYVYGMQYFSSCKTCSCFLLLGLLLIRAMWLSSRGMTQRHLHMWQVVLLMGSRSITHMYAMYPNVSMSSQEW